MGIICSSCGRDIDALGQDNMGLYDPLCEDCFGDRMGHAAPMARSLVERERARLAVRDELDRLRRENEMLKRDPATPAQALAHARELAEAAYADCPERRAALERLEECAMWMGRCTPRETAAPAHGEVELLGVGAAGCRLAAENLLELLRGQPDSLARTLATRAAEECALWIDEIEEDE